jgi:phosphatidate cytidylyltransferase
MKKKLIERLLMFLIGVPLALSVILFLPQRNHLAANIIVVILSALGSIEFAGILRKKNIFIKPKSAIILGITAPLAVTLNVSFDFPSETLFIVFILAASCILVSQIFVKEDLFKDAVNKISAGFSVMIYPGLFMTWIIKMNELPNSSILLLIFLILVFANDSAAWAVGLLFGKGNRGIIAASPNKSVAGFIGGITVSTLIGLSIVFIFPEVFGSQRISSPLAGIILGFLIAIFANLGDLGESVMKRSSEIKDSGNIIPGRGGVLDSIDSLAVAAPIYYITYEILFI